MKKNALIPAASLLLLAVLFAALSLISSRMLGGVRVDLTENGLYTLSEGTQNILEDLDEPVHLYLFFSEDSSRDLPQIRSYARRVHELVDEFANRSDGMLRVHHIDPEPFSEEEDQASQFGLQAVPVGASGVSLYLGIAGTNALDDVQTMPFLQPSKEKFLEYDLAKMISTLGNPERKTIGLMTALPMTAGFDPATQAMREPWVIHDQLSQLFTVETIDLQAPEIPDDIDLLVLVHPRDLGPAMQYRIEQFVLGGGRLVAFLDPMAEMDRGDPGDPMAQMQRGSSSTLGPLLDAWGVKFDTARVLGDLQYGVGSGTSRHIGILSVPREGLNGEDIISSDLEVVNFSSTGWFTVEEPADGDSARSTTLEVLAQSSENAAPVDAARMRFLPDPSELMNGFNPTGDRYALAVRISGPASTAFEQPPEGIEDDDRLTESVDGGIQVVLFADSDVVTDRLWVQKQPFLGQTLVNSFADNGNLVVNAVDNLLGNSDLISIRTRASSGRPFERVNALQAEAERRYRATEERLQQELADTEQKLAELQAARGDDDMLVLSDEQQQEIQRFMDRKLQIRQDLRQVQHDLQRDIDRLGTRLKVLNIIVVPLIVIFVAGLYGLRRRRRQTESVRVVTTESGGSQT
ncbi:Gldg family protein [Elongatibacter sediminis]|uniref:Gldg family protein n=1 Tax=Elongatibacter sediminis TaxID=3119006 RepID=A0AAW9RLJ8_9GAMM